MSPWLRGLLTASIFAGLGPHIGAVCAVTIAVASSAPASEEAASFGLFDGGLGLLFGAGPLLGLLLLVVVGSYFVGGAQAIATGVIASVARSWVRNDLAWAALCTAVGAGTCWALITAVAPAAGPPEVQPWFWPATGAVAGLFCSLISLRIVPKER